MTFWDLFWLLVIFLPLLLLWGFALVDIFRRDDLSGAWKAVWVFVIIVIPWFGTLVYLLFRRPGATPEERQAVDQANREFVARYSPAPKSPSDELKALAELKAQGILTEEEFAAQKAKILGS
jgi:hypothetical protein